MLLLPSSSPSSSFLCSFFFFFYYFFLFLTIAFIHPICRYYTGARHADFEIIMLALPFNLYIFRRTIVQKKWHTRGIDMKPPLFWSCNFVAMRIWWELRIPSMSTCSKSLAPSLMSKLLKSALFNHSILYKFPSLFMVVYCHQGSLCWYILVIFHVKDTDRLCWANKFSIIFFARMYIFLHKMKDCSLITS